jgi:hypothetical protein
VTSWGLRGDSAEHEGTEFLLAKALDHFQPGTPGKIWIGRTLVHKP